MPGIAVIGGTGMDRWPGFEVEREVPTTTPFGAPSGVPLLGKIHGLRVWFLARHGSDHALAPHQINYRANIWALKSLGVKSAVAVAAVGGIAPWMKPAHVAVPVDLIDYTWGRADTYCGEPDFPLRHVECAEPYSERVRRELLHGALAAGIDVSDGGVVGVTQGPRLETPAEIRRMKRDGCDMVGMTGMPEAVLALEAGVDYACLALSVNWAAGLTQGSIHAEIAQWVEEGMAKVRAILQRALPALHAQDEGLEPLR